MNYFPINGDIKYINPLLGTIVTNLAKGVTPYVVLRCKYNAIGDDNDVKHPTFELLSGDIDMLNNLPDKASAFYADYVKTIQDRFPNFPNVTQEDEQTIHAMRKAAILTFCSQYCYTAVGCFGVFEDANMQYTPCLLAVLMHNGNLIQFIQPCGDILFVYARKLNLNTNETLEWSLWNKYSVTESIDMQLSEIEKRVSALEEAQGGG